MIDKHRFIATFSLSYGVFDQRRDCHRSVGSRVAIRRLFRAFHHREPPLEHRYPCLQRLDLVRRGLGLVPQSPYVGFAATPWCPRIVAARHRTAHLGNESRGTLLLRVGVRARSPPVLDDECRGGGDIRRRIAPTSTGNAEGTEDLRYLHGDLVLRRAEQAYGLFAIQPAGGISQDPLRLAYRA